MNLACLLSSLFLEELKFPLCNQNYLTRINCHMFFFIGAKSTGIQTTYAG